MSLAQNSQEEYLSIIKNFMLEIHQRINEDYDTPSIDPSLCNIIDQASIKLKTNKEQISILEKQNKDGESAKKNLKNLKSDQTHLEKRINQKCDEISILRETVKTLYAENERLSMERQNLANQLSTVKQQHSSLKKKVKRQQEQMLSHKNQLKKLTAVAEERFSEYAKSDEHKQQTIKRVTNELDKLKSDLNKKQKSLTSANKKIQQLKNAQSQLDNQKNLVQNLKHQNGVLKSQMEMMKEKVYQERTNIANEQQGLLKQLEIVNDKADKLGLANRQYQISLQNQKQTTKNYEAEILMRTEKLKQKSRQIKQYSQQISRLAKRVEDLSRMSDQIMNENKTLSEKCQDYEEKLQEVKSFQEYASRIKGEINHKKSSELNKLLDSLKRLQGRK